MNGAALQLHTLAPERRAASLLTALLPPLALYAALSLAFSSVVRVPLYAPALLAGAAVLVSASLAPERWSRMLLIVSLALSLGAVAFSSAHDGTAALANRLYASSEAVNAYAYDYFEVTDTASPNAALPWLAVFGGALCAFAARRRIGALTLFFAAVFAEAYFGVTPPAWQNLLLFALLALPLMRERPMTASGAALLAGLAAVALLVFLIAPRPNAAVEAYSERLRDGLGALSQTAAQSQTPPEAENDRARQESRQHEEAANADASARQSLREFERVTEDEREISLPRRTDYARIALLLLASVALLTLPFAPFLLLNRAKRCAAERRAAFETADNAAAIRAMFTHTMDWLRASGLQTENRPYAQCAGAVEALTSADYAARYAAAAAIWQEAAYSAHEPDETKRAAVRALAEETERLLYGRADRRTKFRLKYIACLCE